MRNKIRGARLHHLLLLSTLVTPLPTAAPAHASEPLGASPSATSVDLLTAPPRTLIVDAAAGEVRAIRHPDSFLRYRIRTIDAKGDLVRDTIESRDGTVARLILKDGKPLTPAEDREERDRLNGMIASQSEFNKHIHDSQSGKKLAIELIQLMPDAMLYTYTPGQPQLGPGRSAQQVVVDFAPNPRWFPPTTTAEALTGLRGRMWIDSQTRQVLRMEGNVFRAVNFGWGMLAHVYPGGNLALDQTILSGNRLIFTRFVEQVTIRALMVKTLRENATIEASAFHPLPGPIGYQDAIRLLLEAPHPEPPAVTQARSNP